MATPNVTPQKQKMSTIPEDPTGGATAASAPLFTQSAVNVGNFGWMRLWRMTSLLLRTGC